MLIAAAILVTIAALFLVAVAAVYCFDGTLCGYWVGSSVIDSVLKVAAFVVVALLNAASEN